MEPKLFKNLANGFHALAFRWRGAVSRNRADDEQQRVRGLPPEGGGQEGKGKTAGAPEALK
jgi:hypothetical protein